MQSIRKALRDLGGWWRRREAKRRKHEEGWKELGAAWRQADAARRHGSEECAKALAALERHLALYRHLRDEIEEMESRGRYEGWKEAARKILDTHDEWVRATEEEYR